VVTTHDWTRVADRLQQLHKRIVDLNKTLRNPDLQSASRLALQVQRDAARREMERLSALGRQQ
jgi:hypothetical protein